MNFIQLKALVEHPDQEDSFWLIDIANNKTEIISVNKAKNYIKKDNLCMLFIDAKNTLARLEAYENNNLRIICLNTIKKILASSPASKAKKVHFFNQEEALSWFINTIKLLVTSIEEHNIKYLCLLECLLIIPTLAMERAGLPFLADKWARELKVIAEELKEIREKLAGFFAHDSGFSLFGHESIDLNNGPALKKQLELLLGKKIESTSKSSLENEKHEAAQLLLRYRELARLESAYGESFLARLSNGRIHASFEAIGAQSGRFSCHNPNLQALPGEHRFQTCIRAPESYSLHSLDYGAFELRILAALSADENLLALFAKGQDIHAMTAQALFKEELNNTKNTHIREQAKILNFGLIYGMSEKSLAKKLGTSQSEASRLMNNYFKNFPRVKDYLFSLEQQALNKGVVKTALNRTIVLPPEDEGKIRRLARNAPIQGTGADIIKLAFLRAHHRLKREGLNAQIVNLIHDEIIIECHKDCQTLAIACVKDEMEKAFNAILPNVEALVSVSNLTA